jgi:hypothetical protein
MLSVAILDVAARRRPLKVAVELDAVGWVEVDALDLTAEAFPFSERGHDLQRVAQDHAVCPIGVVLIELGLVDVFG